MTARRANLPRLHVLTPPEAGRDALATVRATLAGGARAVQVRVKTLPDRDHLGFAREVAELCRAAGAVCIVNDRVDIALASGADGVHLGARDLPIEVARQLAGDRLLIGGTARDPRSASAAVAAGADYLGTGPVYATTTKGGLPPPIGLEGLAAVVRAVDVPVIGIAGVSLERVGEVLSTGAHGVAVTAAVTGAEDPRAATRALLDRFTGEADDRSGTGV